MNLFSILFRYFTKAYLSWIAISVVCLTAIISLIQTVELLRRTSNRSDESGDISIAALAFLNIPAVLELILPFALLAGSMLCFDRWNRSNEFVVTRGFGRSIWAVLNPVIVAAALVGVVFVTVVNPIGSITSRLYEKKMNMIFGEREQQMSVSADGIWLRDSNNQGGIIVHGDTLNAASANITKPIIYTFGEDEELNRRIKADAMRLTEKGWIVQNAIEWDGLGNRIQRGNILIPTALKSLELSRSSEPPSTIAFFSLPAFINLLERAGLPSVDHRIHFHKLLSLPIMMIGIALIGAKFTLTNMNRGRRVHLFTRGVGISVSIFLFSHLMQVLGASLRLPPVFAGWAPAIAVILIGAAMLARLDEA
jgi:lipopolysaccharide export system permease protein